MEVVGQVVTEELLPTHLGVVAALAEATFSAYFLSPWNLVWLGHT